jgi:hypothetical protein
MSREYLILLTSDLLLLLSLLYFKFLFLILGNFWAKEKSLRAKDLHEDFFKNLSVVSDFTPIVFSSFYRGASCLKSPRCKIFNFVVL